MSQVTITTVPLLTVINIGIDGGGNNVFNPFLGITDFVVQSCTCRPPVDAKGGTFNIKLVSNDGTNDTANAFLQTISCGNEVVIWIGKSDSSKTLVFRGVIETIEIEEQNMFLMQITIKGPDFGSNILKNRVVTGYWEQPKQADGVTPKPPNNLDPSTLVSTPAQIVQDLLTLSGQYPSGDGVTAASQGIIVTASNIIALNNTPLSQFTSLTEYLDDKITELDDAAQTIHYVDPNKNFIMQPPTQTTANLPANTLLVDDYNDSVALSWSQTSLGLILPGAKYTRTVENYKRRLIGIGGDTIALDQKFETNTTSQNIDVLWYAVRFTPKQRNCYAVGVYIKSIGTPVVDINIILVEDNGNTPTGTPVRTVSIQKEKVTASLDWHYVQLGTDLNTAKNYWVVIPAAGTASNTFSWGKDAGSSNVNANSTDGITWVVNSSSYGFNFREYSSSPLLLPYPTAVSGGDKMLREASIHKATILTRQTMQFYLQALGQTLFMEKHMIKGKIYAPDTLFAAQQGIRIRMGNGSPNGAGYQVDAVFIVGQIEYIFEASESGATGAMTYEIEAVRYVPFP